MQLKLYMYVVLKEKHNKYLHCYAITPLSP